MASILVVSGPQAGQYHPLGKRTLVLGRDEGCPIQIVDESVSRNHVQIRFDQTDNRYHALDMNSANGVFINDRRITGEASLADGDIIKIGNCELFFSALDFTDKDTAFEHYRQHGERGKSTIIP